MITPTEPSSPTPQRRQLMGHAAVAAAFAAGVPCETELLSNGSYRIGTIVPVAVFLEADGRIAVYIGRASKA